MFVGLGIFSGRSLSPYFTMCVCAVLEKVDFGGDAYDEARVL